MSWGSSGGWGLDLNLSPPPARGGERVVESSDDESSSPSSCLSSEGEREQGYGLQWSDSPEAMSMVLAACPRCLMYVMLSEADPRCPRCRSPVLLDFLDHGSANNHVNGGGEDSLNRNSARGSSRRNNRA
ncbi:protein GL2-INTERACTING REPRESSOR 1-like [Phragmites australis]|uniref:protein GL2-INTERACTING REPRESSOR 1-like n=1 Tax=Phragmites australis TaxID=29695 RepID=UPI002D78D8E7|nr:protein GL2-INTERACTING REPRESSOR 1-like [Phragmites australis]